MRDCAKYVEWYSTWSTEGGRGEEAGRGGVEPCTIISLTSCCCWWLKVVKDGAGSLSTLSSWVGSGDTAVGGSPSCSEQERTEEQLSGDWSRPPLSSRF